MKVSQNTLNDIVSKMRIALNHLDHKNSLYVDNKRNLWNLWLWIVAEVSCEDNSGRFKGRGRLFRHNRDFNMYPDNTDDAAMTTALKAAIKKV